MNSFVIELMTIIDLLGSRTEHIRNRHLNDTFLMDLVSHPKVVSMVADLLGTDDINIFATRLLCKMPEVGSELPWHQDSRYFNLTSWEFVTFWLGTNRLQ